MVAKQKVNMPLVLAFVSSIIALFILIHHWIIKGGFDPADFLHHEFFWGVFIAFTVGILVAYWLMISQKMVRRR